MRVAVCFSGQPRFLEEGHKTIYRNLIKPFNADVFVHTWFDKDKIGQHYDGSLWNFQQTDIIKPDTDKKILDLYKPIKYVIEPQREFKYNSSFYEEKLSKGQSIYASHSMFYSLKQSNNLKRKFESENNFKYDCVVRARFDLKIFSKVDYSKYDLSKINYRHANPEVPVIDDQFGFANSAVMDIYSAVYKNIFEYFTKVNKYSNEMFLTYHLYMNNIYSNKTDIRVEIIRGAE